MTPAAPDPGGAPTDINKWLVGLSGLIGPLAAGFAVGGPKTLVGDVAHNLFTLAVIATGLSFIFAVVGIAVSGRGRMWTILAGASFALAIGLAVASAAASRSEELEDLKIGRTKPLIAWSLEKDELEINFSIRGVSRFVPVTLQLGTAPNDRNLLLPRRVGYTDEKGAVSLKLKVGEVAKYEGRLLLVEARWQQRVRGKIEPQGCREPVLYVPPSSRANSRPVNRRPLPFRPGKVDRCRAMASRR